MLPAAETFRPADVAERSSPGQHGAVATLLIVALPATAFWVAAMALIANWLGVELEAAYLAAAAVFIGGFLAVVARLVSVR